MEDYAAKFAEFLEQVATRITSMTVDRVSRGIKVTGLGILVATLGLSALIFLLWALFGALEIPLTTAGAFALLGLLLLGVGGFFWFTRSR
ncbi:MAG: hypothetical protein L0Z49_05760 [Actinobacteria bacterium]|nr:hypothetical protein [Actinomycetota bacterium]MCI0543937.1 hypothetical protein [Actinomycetota bacterium]MCI0678209.1 hypothetical protein [Actinomycetota bacterium]